MRISAARASSSSGRALPSSASARASSRSSASASSARKVSTRARDSSAALSSKDGFSVVAPISVTVPSSITGRKLSCWARLKRWISSTNSSVPCPVRRRRTGLLENLLQVGDAGEDGRDLHEGELRRLGQQPRHRGLAGAGRSPENQRAEAAASDQPGQRAFGADQVILARHLVQLGRTQPIGERSRNVTLETGGGEKIGQRLLQTALSRRSRSPCTAVPLQRQPPIKRGRCRWSACARSLVLATLLRCSPRGSRRPSESRSPPRWTRLPPP